MKKAAMVIFAITTIGILAFVFTRDSSDKNDQSSSTSPNNQSTVSAVPASDSDTVETSTPDNDQTIAAIVSYTNDGFSPSIIGPIAVGDTVRFINESDFDLRVASDVHPTHEILPDFDTQDILIKGQMYEYTFMKAGDWAYHNHLSPDKVGQIQVLEQ